MRLGFNGKNGFPYTAKVNRSPLVRGGYCLACLGEYLMLTLPFYRAAGRRSLWDIFSPCIHWMRLALATILISLTAGNGKNIALM